MLFSKSNINRSIKGANRNEIKRQSYAKLHDIIENAICGANKKVDVRHQDRVLGQELYYNVISYDGVIYGVEIAVDVPVSKGLPKSYAGHKIRPMKIVPGISGSFPKGQGPDSTSTITISITDIIKIFNPSDDTKINKSDIEADICASFQECVSKTLVKKLRHALDEKGYKQVVIAGGVAANSELRRKVFALQDEGYAVFAPMMKYCTDNAAMVGACAFFDTNTFKDFGVEVFSRA